MLYFRMLNLCISAVSSNSGKTIFTTALLYYFQKKARAFKIGPDFIDPQFHKIVSKNDSINLDSFMMNDNQVKWIFNHYKKDINIVEGVMGFYDGENKGCSAYSISKLLQIPTILVLDGSGSYITISAILKGLRTYKKDNTIKAIVLNKLSSQNHFNLIEKQIKKDHKDILILGWIEKNIPSLQDTHLGLNLDDLSKIKTISKDILKHIDISILNKLKTNFDIQIDKYPFKTYKKQNKTLAIVYDKNFSFLYYDNLQFLKEIFKKVIIIDSTKDEKITKDIDIVYICGGYVEDNKHYNNIKNSNKFKKSLIKHSKTKLIYAECAGLLYLGKYVDDKKMSGILDVKFILEKRFTRLGYYYNESGTKGHCFHYTRPKSTKKGFDILSKTFQGKGDKGSWQKGKVFGTYLHTMFRETNPILV